MLAKVRRSTADPQDPHEAADPDEAADGDEVAVVLVDSCLLEQWAGWNMSDRQHVIGPVDLARRARGHDVVMPWCLERIDVFLARRAVAAAPLIGGEIVTMAVSVLRGTAEVWGAHPGAQPAALPGPAGSWWLTDEGRPVFVHALADEQQSVEAGAREIIDTLSSSCEDRAVLRLLDKAAALCETPRQLPRVIDECESHFFAAAAPRPLATTVFPAALARDIDAPSLRPGHDPASGEGRIGHLRDAIARHIDADLGDMVAVRLGAALRSVRGRLSRGHRLPWLAAGAVAALIVLGGVLWPSGEPAVTAAVDLSAASPPPSGAAPTRDAAAPEPTAAGPPATEAPIEPSARVPESGIVFAAAGLLDSLAVCRAAADEAHCLAAITETPGLNPPTGAVDLAQNERAITLIDDYGGAGLVQVSAVDGASAAQLVVLVRREDKWLLRDVYDVAKQPDG